MILSRTSNKAVVDALHKVEYVLLMDDFELKMNNKKSFDMATCDGRYVFDLIKNNQEPCYIYTYRSKNPWSRAYAYFNPSQPDRMYLNTRKLNRSTGSIAATIIHEYIHFLDHLDKNHSFGHGDNSPVGKANTCPYWVDNLMEALIEGKKPDFNNNDSHNIITYVPWYKRAWNWVRRVL